MAVDKLYKYRPHTPEARKLSYFFSGVCSMDEVNYLNDGDHSQFSEEHQETARSIEAYGSGPGSLPDAGGQSQNGDGEGDGEEDGEEDDEVEVDANLRETYQQAKSLVQLRAPPKSWTSSVWKLCKPCAIIDEGQWPTLKTLDEKGHDKMRDGIDNGKPHVACTVCYHDPSRSLEKCLVKPSYRKGKVDGTSNISKHLKRAHSAVYQASKAKNFSYDPGVDYESQAGPTARSSTTAPEEVSALGSPAASDVYFQKYREAGDDSVLRQFQHLVHEFATNNNIPERCVTRHHECPEFRRLIMYAIQHASQLKRIQNLVPGRE